MPKNKFFFCMCPVPSRLKTRAALLERFAWPKGATITVRFLEGERSLRDRVMTVAREWVGPGMANLTLQERVRGDADIRIAFVQGNGSWSMIGRDCLGVPQNEPTMNFGWLTPSSPDSELRRVVLHEFGHALGLIHEHQNPDRPIRWNKAAVYRDLGRSPNNWSKAKVDTNMFRKYEPGELASTALDPKSIMLYPIPQSWTLDGFSSSLNSGLSQKDKELIRSVYR